MNYTTVREASLKWDINVRQVQNLCEKGKVKDAIRFNHTWAIPENAIKPQDGRCRRKVACDDEMEAKEEVFSEELLIFKQIIDHFPYSINVTNKEGIMLYANDVFFDGTLEETRGAVLGLYNILQEEMIGKWGLREHLKRAFRGETVFTTTLKLDYKDVADKYGKEYPFISVYNDIASFPIFDESNQLKYVVSVFIPVRKYMGRYEIVNAREYIEEHWEEPFDIILISKTVNLSRSHLLRLFREQTGFSPHDYYRQIKMKHLKNMLLDFSISVSKAFNNCGIDYNSYYSSLFKKHTGLTPTQFRKNHQ